ncbi:MULTISPECIES: SPOR domain-containing protein [unclassified Snodgrassella]|uniref:SPOR domain-containing protein n=1 Tax=unclassified Snodgrassella TaxID=2625236 RepID=UPI0018DE3700|nr:MULTISPECIES: SPOR domain-containing protein [unclassified Snodgrassella]MBI0158610.1 SPOR domain-containing protein [Snodgrassella sp. W6238H11]MBI0160803.1 SPOR domain-containing protein [Snodgrassella sp. W6238H14]
MNAQENYEQLKRRNRRRLVGALIMVVIAAILLVIMLSRRTPQSVPAPQLEVRTASSETASGTAGMVSQASVVAQAQSASAIVLEPVTAARSSSVNTTVGSGNASAVSEHKQENSISRPVMREETTHPKPVLPAKINNTPVPPERRPNDTDSAGIKPSSERKFVEKNNRQQVHSEAVPVVKPKPVINRTPVETTEKTKQVPVNTASSNRPKTEPVTVKPANKTPASTVDTTPVVKNRSEVANTDKKPVSATPKPINKNPVPVKPAATAKPANNTAGGKLTPQQILENKAAGTVSKNSASGQNRGNATSSNNKPSLERTVIQIGAYTTEAQANLVQQRLAVAGVTTSISKSQTSKGTLYRVRSQVYNNRSQALQNLDKVHAAGLDGLVIGL